jgi:predicted nucleic acid-binding protein
VSDARVLHLVDSSVWIVLLRAPRGHPQLADRVDALLAAGTAATAGIIRLEVLRGARGEAELDRLDQLFRGLHYLPTDDVTWDAAARLGLQLRLRGVTVPTTDLLIAAIAIGVDATLIHRDGDFDVIAQHAPLRVERYP